MSNALFIYQALEPEWSFELAETIIAEARELNYVVPAMPKFARSRSHRL